jgi:hypothetical protein
VAQAQSYSLEVVTPTGTYSTSLNTPQKDFGAAAIGTVLYWKVKASAAGYADSPWSNATVTPWLKFTYKSGQVPATLADYFGFYSGSYAGLTQTVIGDTVLLTGSDIAGIGSLNIHSQPLLSIEGTHNMPSLGEINTTNCPYLACFEFPPSVSHLIQIARTPLTAIQPLPPNLYRPYLHYNQLAAAPEMTPYATIIKLFHNCLTAAALDALMIDLDNQGASYGFLQVQDQKTGQKPTLTAPAFLSLVRKGWTIYY